MCAASSGKKKFKPPSEEVCLDAIGLRKLAAGATAEHQVMFNGEVYEVLHTDAYAKSGEVPQDLLNALRPDKTFFDRIPKPNADDWLANQNECGQTFRQFTRGICNTPNRCRNTIYILPLSFFESVVPEEVISSLVEFASLFFEMPVKIMKATNWKDSIPSRINEYTYNKQVHAGSILDHMKQKVPPDAFCVGALTLCDIYPRDSWNFVFGLASLHDGVGVYSLARHMPQHTSTADMSADERAELLLRACRLMVHEIGHMFGLKHCIHYHCLMMGSNHFEESDAKPLHLCPVCLRKLQLSCGFSISERYQKMAEFCDAVGLKAQADWFQRRQASLKT